MCQVRTQVTDQRRAAPSTRSSGSTSVGANVAGFSMRARASSPLLIKAIRSSSAISGAEVGRLLGIGRAAPDQLDVAAGDGQRGPQLVRRAPGEVELAPALRAFLDGDLLQGPARRLPSPDVPHGGEERPLP